MILQAAVKSFRRLWLASMVLAMATPAKALLYRNAMEEPTGAEFRVVSTGDTDPSDGFSDPDATVEFGVDYATFGVGPGAAFPASVPEAPNTQAGDRPRTGLFVSANDSENVFSRVSEVSVIPLPIDGPVLNALGPYSVQVDVWSNFGLSAIATTETAGLVVGHDGVSPGRSSGGGFLFNIDGGATGDFRLTKAPQDTTTAALSGSAGDQQILAQPDGAGQDGQYNPEIAAAYFADDDFSPNVGVRGARDNANDFWEDALELRTDLSNAFEPATGQGDDQQGQPIAALAPGDVAFRWSTIRMEVDPTVRGVGSRDELGVADVYFSATWRDEVGGSVVIRQSPELYIGRIDNSIDRPDYGGLPPAVIDLSKPPALVFGDYFSSFDGSGYNFAIFDNLIVTSSIPEPSAMWLLGLAAAWGPIAGYRNRSRRLARLGP